METTNIKKLYIGNKEVKILKINNKIAWQGLPEFTIGDVSYNPDTFPSWYNITNNTTVNFSNFDNTSFRVTAYLVGGGGGGNTCWGYNQGHMNWAKYNRIQVGAGGQGGEIITAIPTIVENTNYPIVIGSGGSAGVATVQSASEWSKYITTVNATDGGNTTAFGSTARGGKAGSSSCSGQISDSSQYNVTPLGGTGNGGANGGNGIYKSVENTDRPLTTIGGNGTSINGTYYGAGGSGGGYNYTYYYGEWSTQAVISYDGPGDALGYGNRGSGGKGASIYSERKSGNQGTWGYMSVTSQATAGQNGIVLMKIEEI